MFTRSAVGLVNIVPLTVLAITIAELPFRARWILCSVASASISFGNGRGLLEGHIERLSLPDEWSNIHDGRIDLRRLLGTGEITVL